MSDCKTLDVQHLPAYMYDRLFGNKVTSGENTEDERDIPLNTEDFKLNRILEAKEKEIILKVLKITKGNKTKAGEILGIPRQTLKYKIDKLNLE